MAMVCPKCRKSFEQALHCPTCGARLLYESKQRRGEEAWARSGGHLLHTPIGRFVAGILLAQGMAYGLQLLCNAGLQAAVDTQSSVWTTLFGLVLLQAIQGLSLLAGGALAGAGQKHAGVLGAVVGLAHSILFLLVQHWHGEKPTEMALYGQPVLHIAFGALGAVFGASIWRPLPVVAMPEFETDRHAKPSGERISIFAALRGPVAWSRVFAGIIIVTGGFLWGPGLLTVVLEASQGKLKVTDHLQARLVTWEIIGLATLLGAAIAGATTRNGLKQGMCVGVGASILLIGNYLGGKTVPLEQILYTAFSILGLTIAGGWFGGQLFPPVLAFPHRREMGSAI